MWEVVLAVVVVVDACCDSMALERHYEAQPLTPEEPELHRASRQTELNIFGLLLLWRWNPTTRCLSVRNTEEYPTVELKMKYSQTVTTYASRK